MYFLYFVVIACIFLGIIIWFKFAPKQLEPEPPYVHKKPLSYTETMRATGMTEEEITRWANHLSDINFKSKKTNENALPLILTAQDYQKSDYKHAYERSKKEEHFREFTAEDGVFFETEVGIYKLKRKYRNVCKSIVPKDHEKTKGKDFKTFESTWDYSKLDSF